MAEKKTEEAALAASAYPNETIRTIEERFSVRRFIPNSITEEERKIITSAALRAPNGGRMSKFSLIDVRDPAIKKKLSVSCDHQPFIATAPGVYAVMADFRRWFRVFNLCVKTSGTQLNYPREDEILLSAVDALLAAENMVIAAESLGISSCFIADMIINYKFHRDLFKLPKYVMPVTLLVFGRRAPEVPVRRSPRIDIDVVHRDFYHDPTDEELKNMIRPLLGKNKLGEEIQTVEDYVNRFYLRRLGGALSFERANNVREMFAEWLENPYEE